jgi:hypothetical protein
MDSSVVNVYKFNVVHLPCSVLYKLINFTFAQSYLIPQLLLQFKQSFTFVYKVKIFMCLAAVGFCTFGFTKDR